MSGVGKNSTIITEDEPRSKLRPPKRGFDAVHARHPEGRFFTNRARDLVELKRGPVLECELNNQYYSVLFNSPLACFLLPRIQQ